MADNNFKNLSNESSVTTNGWFYSNPPEVDEAALMQVSYWNDCFTVSMYRELQEYQNNKKNGIKKVEKRWDMANGLKLSLWRPKVVELVFNVKKYIIPAIESGTYSVKDGKEIRALGTLTRDSLLQFELVEKGNVLKPQLSLYRGFDNIIDGLFNHGYDTNITYKFNDLNNTVCNYNFGAEVYDKLEENVTDFYMFIEDMENFVNASSKAYVHANRHYEQLVKDTKEKRKPAPDYVRDPNPKPKVVNIDDMDDELPF